MPLLMLGVDLHSFPIEVRHVYHPSPERIRSLLTARCILPRDIPGHPVVSAGAVAVDEAAIFSTCDRLEFYVVAAPSAGKRWLRTRLHQIQGDVCPVLPAYAHQDRAAVEHLLRVATGAEPALFGQSLVLHHLADALDMARGCGSAGPRLARLFGQALAAGRRAHAESAGALCTAALGPAVVDFVCARHPQLSQLNVLVVGAGRVARLVIQALKQKGTASVAVVNRTAARADTLARGVHGRTFPWHQLRSALGWADLVIAATAARYPILDVDDLAAVQPQRQGRPLILMDLGLPRNVQVAVQEIEGMRRYDLDDLRLALEASSQLGCALPPGVAEWVQEQADVLWAWLDAYKAVQDAPGPASP